MPIIRITKAQVKKAQQARKASLKKDPEFRAFEEDQERLLKEALKRKEPEEEAS